MYADSMAHRAPDAMTAKNTNTSQTFAIGVKEWRPIQGRAVVDTLRASEPSRPRNQVTRTPKDHETRKAMKYIKCECGVGHSCNFCHSCGRSRESVGSTAFGTPISFESLRANGFRIESHHVDSSPHMIYCLDGRYDRAIEVAQSHASTREWTVWFRSDIAHTKCRFLFLRTVTQMEQLNRLVQSISDERLPTIEYDSSQFSESMCREKEDCKRRYLEYAKRNLRYSHIPGG